MISKIEGRNDDIIYLEGLKGRDVPIHPIHFHTTIGALPEIKQYQVVHDEAGIHISVVLRKETSFEKVDRTLKENLRCSLASLGARCPNILVQYREKIEHDSCHMGKLKMVKSTIRRHGRDDAPLLH
jgi:phenylacetate-coenzyme A ligase PaaK-like adenylate-forming protein